MKTHIEINSFNLVHNLKSFHTLSQKNIMFVVKANAYGHGLRETIQAVRDCNFISYFLVDSIFEALLVQKEIANKPILVIGWSDKDEIVEIIKNGFETVISSEDQLKSIIQIQKRIGIQVNAHLKIETGTARLGFDPNKVVDILNKGVNKEVCIKGIYSHFANIEDTSDPSYAQYQLKCFNAFLKKINHNKFIKHFSCSASALLFPETYFDMIRVGVSGYGYWPSKHTYLSFREKNCLDFSLKRALSWYSKIAQIKFLEKGTPIGYGLTYKALNRTKIAIIPVGYFDGLDRRLSNLGQVIISGDIAPIRGRICMNMCMVEISHIRDVKMGDKVILIGEEGSNKIDADNHALLMGSINYEVLSRINPLIPRILI